MHTWLLDLLVCPECRGALRLEAAEQTGESVNNNKDDGQVGQAGDQQTGESVNGNHDDGQVGDPGSGGIG